MAEVNTIMLNFTNIVRGIAISVAVLFLCVGALQYMAAGGNPRQMETGKTTMTGALIGLAVIFAASILANTIRSAIPS
jgi:ABC-type amino acid transport system permease subunit